jgi:hypothetical protein
MLHVCGYELRSRIIPMPIVRSRTHELGGKQVSRMTCMKVRLWSCAFRHAWDEDYFGNISSLRLF